MDTKLRLCYCEIAVDADITLSATQLRSYIGYESAQNKVSPRQNINVLWVCL